MTNLPYLPVMLCLIAMSWRISSTYESIKHFSESMMKREMSPPELLEFSSEGDDCLCLQWTRWMPLGSPKEMGNVPYTYSSLLKYGKMIASSSHVDICAMPLSSDCRILVHGYNDGAKRERHVACPHVDDALAPEPGLVQMRFLCWDWNCPCLQWSAWYNKDGPSNEGDLEILGDTITKENWPCPFGSRPLDVECRTADGRALSETTNRMVKCDLNGLKCLNRWQAERCNCEDYKVRFLCWVFSEERMSSAEKPVESGLEATEKISRVEIGVKGLLQNDTLDGRSQDSDEMHRKHMPDLDRQTDAGQRLEYNGSAWSSPSKEHSAKPEHLNIDEAKLWSILEPLNFTVATKSSTEQPGTGRVFQDERPEKVEEGTSDLKIAVQDISVEPLDVMDTEELSKLGEVAQQHEVDTTENETASLGPELGQSASEGGMNWTESKSGASWAIRHDSERSLVKPSDTGEMKQTPWEQMPPTLNLENLTGHDVKMEADSATKWDWERAEPLNDSATDFDRPSEFDGDNETYAASHRELKFPKTETVMEFPTTPLNGSHKMFSEIDGEPKNSVSQMASTEKLAESKELREVFLGDVTPSVQFRDHLHGPQREYGDAGGKTKDGKLPPVLVTQRTEVKDFEANSFLPFTIPVTSRDGSYRYSPAESVSQATEKLPETKDLRAMEPEITVHDGLSQEYVLPKEHHKGEFIGVEMAKVAEIGKVGVEDSESLQKDVISTPIEGISNGDGLFKHEMPSIVDTRSNEEVKRVSAQQLEPVSTPHIQNVTKMTENLEDLTRLDSVTEKFMIDSVHNASQTDSSEPWDNRSYIKIRFYEDSALKERSTLFPVTGSSEVLEDYGAPQQVDSFTEKNAVELVHNVSSHEDSTESWDKEGRIDSSMHEDDALKEMDAQFPANVQSGLPGESTQKTHNEMNQWLQATSFWKHSSDEHKAFQTHNLTPSTTLVHAATELFTTGDIIYAHGFLPKYRDATEDGEKRDHQQPPTAEGITQTVAAKKSDELVPKLDAPSPEDLLDKTYGDDDVANQKVQVSDYYPAITDIIHESYDYGASEVAPATHKLEIIELDQPNEGTTDSLRKDSEDQTADHALVQKAEIVEPTPLLKELESNITVVNLSGTETYEYSTSNSYENRNMVSFGNWSFPGNRPTVNTEIQTTDHVTRKSVIATVDYSFGQEPILPFNKDDLKQHYYRSAPSSLEGIWNMNDGMTSAPSKTEDISAQAVDPYTETFTTETPIQKHHHGSSSDIQQQRSVYGTNARSNNSGTMVEVENEYGPKLNLISEWKRSLAASDHNAFRLPKWQFGSRTLHNQKELKWWPWYYQERSYLENVDHGDGRKFVSGDHFLFNKQYSNKHPQNHERHSNNKLPSPENGAYSIVKQIFQNRSPGWHRIIKYRSNGTVDYEMYIKQH